MPRPILITHLGQTRPLYEWAASLRRSPGTLANRYRALAAAGPVDPEALFAPGRWYPKQRRPRPVTRPTVAALLVASLAALPPGWYAPTAFFPAIDAAPGTLRVQLSRLCKQGQVLRARGLYSLTATARAANKLVLSLPELTPAPETTNYVDAELAQARALIAQLREENGRLRRQLLRRGLSAGGVA